MRKIVILVNLGGPDSYEGIGPFLQSLLSDPYVVRLPFPLRPLQSLLVRLIVARRLPQSRELYSVFGGKSPINAITKAQAKRLAELTGLEVLACQRHSSPGFAELKETLEAGEPPSEITILPLYPQYSTSTTESSFAQLKPYLDRKFPDTPVRYIQSYPDHPMLIEAWLDRLRARGAHIQKPYLTAFSAHGVPQSYVRDGDPYLDQLRQTVAAIGEQWNSESASLLCFQSKFGPERWLEPSTNQLIETLAPGTRLLVAPISFVSDHVETTYEIGVEFKELAESRGVHLFHTPGLNLSPQFMACLVDLLQHE